MLRLFFVILLLLNSMLLSHANITGMWKEHPAMQTVTYTNPYHTVKIIPGKTRTYFLVHADMYYANGPEYSNTPYLSLFYHDNEADVQSDFMLPVNDIAGNFSACMLDCAYSPEMNLLFGILDSGETFTLHDNGSFHKGENITRATTPGKLKINGISFDPANRTAWVATLQGISAFNTDSLCKTTEISSSFNVVAVGVVGNRLIASLSESDNEMPTLRTAPLSNVPFKISKFDQLILSSGSQVTNVTTPLDAVVCLSEITPLTDNTFAFLSQASSGQGLSVNIITFQNDDCRLLQLHSQALTVIPNNSKANTNYEGFVTSCTDGYNFKLKNILHVAKGVDPDPLLDNEAAIKKFKEDCAWKQINVENNYLGYDLANAKAGSWNNLDFWFYIPNKGFVRRTVDKKIATDTSADKTWLYSSMPLKMNAPSVHHAAYFSWHPNYGMLCRQHGPDNFFKITGAYQLDNLCGYKNGKWTDYGLALRNYDSRLVHYDTFGATVDPDNSDFVYSGSYQTGILRLNLTDPADLLHITTGNNYNPSTRSYDVKISDYFDIFTPTNKAWSWFSEPLFDADGNLWSSYFWGLDCNRGETLFCCWTADDRNASAKANSENGFRKWKTLHVKSGIDRTNRQILLPLKKERNKNILVYNAGDYGSDILIYNHGGTIENTTDDKYVIIKNPVDSLGRNIEYDYASTLFEDPVDGYVWFLTQTGVYRFDPVAAFTQNERLNRLELADAAEYNGKSVMMETFGANTICTDAKGRKWIGTHHNGIICVSRDSSALLAHLTDDNSNLANNTVTALGWNPENNSLMISTLKGIQEFIPNEGNVADNNNITAFPQIVTPGFSGFVTFSSLDNSKEYELLNLHSGELVKLDKPQNGIIQWNLADSNNNKAGCGNYSLRITNQTDELVTILIVD